MSRSARSLVIAWALAAADIASGGVFTLVPATPTAGQFLRVSATYTPGCSPISRSVEREDQELRFVVVEPCECPPFPLSPITMEETLAPLHEGTVHASLRVRKSAGDALCAPEATVEEIDLPVPPSTSFRFFFLEPQPDGPSDLRLVAESACPVGWKGPSIQGRTLRLLAGDTAIGAPCTATPSWVDSFPLPDLLPGEYTVEVFTDAPEAPILLFASQITRTAGNELRLGGDLAVYAHWRAAGGASGEGRAQRLTAESGAFWFFAPSNLELMVKVLDGCALNGHRWLFAAGLTDVGVELTAVDVASGAQRVYRNPLGRPFEPLLDTAAFPCT